MNETFIGRQRFFWPGQGQYLNFWQFSQTILGERYVLYFNCVYNITYSGGLRAKKISEWPKSKKKQAQNYHGSMRAYNPGDYYP